eukprot:4996857-Ditylum_brightwellii.AAC.1
MVKVPFDRLSQSSNKEEVAGDKQSNTENDMLEQNKSDEQQITIQGKNGKEDGMEIVEEKIS